MKTNPDGWKLCAEKLLIGPFSNDHAIFFCFQVIENFITKQYSTINDKDRQALHHIILTLFEKDAFTTIFLQNKFAHVVNQLFLIDYSQQKWNDFFKDFLSRCSNGKRCDIFLRILFQINTDLADVEISKTNIELNRNTFIKDFMRETCVLDLAHFWFNIIVSFLRLLFFKFCLCCLIFVIFLMFQNNSQEYPPTTVCLCLDVIGAYISWIDINLITNDNFMMALFSIFSNPHYRCSLLDCFGSILKKGMDPLTKLQFIENFLKIDSIKDSLNIIFTPEFDDISYLRKLSNFFNTIGVELIDAYRKHKDKTNAEAAAGAFHSVNTGLNVIANCIESKFQLMCQFLSSNDLKTSFKIHIFVRDYVQWMSQHLKEDGTFFQSQTIEDKIIILLRIIVEKTKITNNDDEELFDDVRKSLKNLFDNLLVRNSKIVRVYLCDKIISPTLTNWKTSSLPFVDIEVALYLLCILGDSQSALQSGLKEFEDVLQLLIASNISSYPEENVQLHYFRIVLRYEKFYNFSLTHLFPQILASFLDERGMRNSNCNVRTKVCKLLKGFIKASYTKSKTINHDKHQFTEAILNQLQEFLKLDIVFDDPFCLEECDLDDYLNSSYIIREESIKFPYAISNLDQLQIYETIVYLLITSPFYNIDRKRELIKIILQDVWTSFEVRHKELSIISSEICQNGFMSNEHKSALLSKQLFAAFHLCHPINLVAASTKAFSNVSTVSSFAIGDLYLESFKNFMKTIELKVSPEATFVLQSSIRRYLHRLIVCMSEEEMTPLLPDAIKALFLSGDDISVKSLQELIPLLSQIISKYSNKELHPFLKQMFVPLVELFQKRIVQSINEAEKLALQRCFFNYLYFMICGSALMTEFYLLGMHKDFPLFIFLIFLSFFFQIRL